MPSKPVVRSLAYLRKTGWTVCSVEKWIPARGAMKFGVRIDAFGFGDLLACRRQYDEAVKNSVGVIALVQTTDWTHISKHRDKILVIPAFYKWKEAGGVVLLHGWKKRPKGGVRGAQKVWTLKEEVL